ncbi:MAG: 1-acyl-sn-glycerol-3-phosphate acyltransferase [Deltaproteobacteria bacterium]|jgi:1-acyl-sn-glycerol-3-phosphate acyltransferase|nr:1-acyl-sn-glycerol-3-phosphate acyltransferase [Deltaproteobacteria bacterium]MBW2542950.1 1-acyl-sn-glycerol-3-phosphate acyltransferase [Deltaproteobacteria bacterium]
MQRISRLAETPAEDVLPTRSRRFGQLAMRGWRILATGFAFVEAGILSLLLAACAAGLQLLPGDRERGEMRTQRGIHWLTRFYLGGLSLLGAFRVRCSGGEKLRRPGILVVANHPTLLDAWALMSQMPQADCIVKERYYENFFLGGAARAAGFIPNREGADLIDECVERLRRGRSLIVFPEGTRSPTERLGPFARGAAHIALRSGCDPIPVTLRCNPATLYHGQAWWDVPYSTPILSLTVGDPIPIKDVVDTEMSRGRAARELTTYFREYFERQLARG